MRMPNGLSAVLGDAVPSVRMTGLRCPQHPDLYQRAVVDRDAMGIVIAAVVALRHHLRPRAAAAAAAYV